MGYIVGMKMNTDKETQPTQIKQTSPHHSKDVITFHGFTQEEDEHYSDYYCEDGVDIRCRD